MGHKAINAKEALDLLSFYLQKNSLKRTFVICGGAALILQNAVRSDRTTTDVDVVAPEIDDVLRKAAVSVSEQLGLSPQWLNSDPKGLAAEMAAGWEARVFEVYASANLIVQSISRRDMIFAKFYALCDRQRGDAQDLMDLQVTEDEIDVAANLTALKDSNPNWPKHVEEERQKLKRKLGYER